MEEKKPMGWKELYLKEDWWAIYLGLGVVIVAIAFFYAGTISGDKQADNRFRIMAQWFF